MEENTIKIEYTIQCTGDHEVLVNGHTLNSNGITQPLHIHKVNCLEVVGNVKVNKLILDGIDTEHFIHHGFVDESQRGNQATTHVKYFFRIPIWNWYLDWKQNDNSTIRQISKTHQGFIPL